MATKKAKATGSAGNGEAALQWSSESLACVSAYTILEAEEFMDEFEDVEHPFNGAASLQMGDLWYYPHTTRNAAMIALLAEQRAVDFLGYLVDVYKVKKKNPNEASSRTIERFAAIFRNKQGTLLQLAKAVKLSARFPGEQ